MARDEVGKRLRDRLVGELHLGRLHTGDRLPGVREVADEMGVGVRAVVRAYRELEREGLVEIRSRSGVYVAPQERLDGQVLEETASWLADVLVEAVKRRVPVPRLPEFVRRCTATIRPRCVLLESTEDHLAVLAHELEEELGFEVQALDFRRIGGSGRSGSMQRPEIPGAMADAHLLVTTTYHAASARAVAESLGKPLVVVTVHPTVAATLDRRLRADVLTVVCVDPDFGDRVKAVYGGQYADRVRVITVDQREALRSLDPEEPVMLTLAARRRLGEAPPRTLLPHSPSISPESARELTTLLIRMNIAAERAGGDDQGAGSTGPV